MLGLAICGQVRDEGHELALIFCRRGNQLAIGQVSDGLVISHDLKSLLVSELVDLRGKLLGGRLDRAETFAAHAVRVINHEHERASFGTWRTEKGKLRHRSGRKFFARNQSVLGKDRGFVERARWKPRLAACAAELGRGDETFANRQAARKLR